MMEYQGSSKTSIENQYTRLITFFRYLEKEGIDRLEDVTEKVIDEYQDYLYYYEDKYGNQISVCTRISKLSSLSCFFRNLVQANVLLHNPCLSIKLPKREQRLPKGILSKKEVKSLLCAPNLKRVYGFRDRTLLEILYSCGLRSAELAALQVQDIDFGNGLLKVNEGKGLKDRVIPIGKIALEFTREYIDKVRPFLIKDGTGDLLFPTKSGRAYDRSTLHRMFLSLTQKAKLERRVNARHFRYTLATDLLKNGVDLRYVQEILGHENLNTTTIYAQVFQKDLKRVHKKTHPREQLKEKDVEYLGTDELE